MTFAIRPLFPGGAGGIVTAVVAAGGVQYHIVVRNLVPGSAHTIHDHLGSCTGAGGSRRVDGRRLRSWSWCDRRRRRRCE
ncbi:MAG TPA: hypothetical protein VKJ07_18165 [Mycobacteriales bacterium]|nr:hypothetical protein [Mycobacteriales bacterium]